MAWPMTMTGLPRAGAVSKQRGYKLNVQKMKGILEKIIFNGETVWRIQTKNFKKSTPPMENKTKEPQDPKGKNWTWTM